MFKFVGTLRNGSRLAPRSSFWCIPSHQMIAACSKTAIASKSEIDKEPVTSPESPKVPEKPNKRMVSQVFGKLTDEKGAQKAKTVNELLRTGESSLIHHDTAVKTVTTLCQWVETGKIRFTDFEHDWRYQKLCRVLAGKSGMKSKIPNEKKKARSLEEGPSIKFVYGANDMNETFEDVRDIPLSQTIKILSRLATRQKRTKPLLESLAENITKSSEPLDIKKIADILYSMAKLNFPHQVLLQKLSEDLLKVIRSVDQSPIIGSILTSIGMLRYRDDSLMDELCNWAIEHKKIMRTQDLCAFLMTLATVGYVPVNADPFFKDSVGILNETDMIKSSEWVDVVWSLTVLNKATPEQISSTLHEKFIRKFAESEEVPLAKKHKLLNINAAAKSLLKNYNGALLKTNSVIFDAPLSRTKDKQIFIKSITDALANLFPSRDHFRTNVDHGNGFLIDVEFFIDEDNTPLLVEKAGENTKALKIAVLAHYYHDYCLGNNSLAGSTLLHQRLLEANGYKIIDIPHSDFHADDKLLKRITFINDRIKSIAK